MRATPLRLLQQAFRLQKGLGPCIAPQKTVVVHQMLVKMLCREAAVPAAIKRFHLNLLLGRHPFPRHLAKPPVQQTRLAVFLVTLTPTPKCPLANTQKLRRFQLTELRGLVPTKNIQELDHSHTLMGFCPAHSNPNQRDQNTGQIVCYLNRTYRVLPTASRPRIVGRIQALYTFAFCLSCEVKYDESVFV